MEPVLAALGFGPDLAAAVPDGTLVARVARVDRGMVRALGVAGEVRLWLGQLRPLAVPPTTGDWVAHEPGSDEVHTVLPRRTALVRAGPHDEAAPQVLAANVDIVAICADLSVGLHPRRLERFTTMAWASGATPLLVLTKADAVEAGAAPELLPVDEAVALARRTAPGVDVLVASGTTGDGVPALRDALGGWRTLVLVGPSGVGKSTLVNALVGRTAMATGDVRAGDGKGRHTTTTRELIPVPGGGVLLDTPGLRSLVPWAAGDGLDRTFPEIAELAGSCRFDDCSHTVEPGCAVREAVDAGQVDAERFDGWQKLRVDVDRVAAGAAVRSAGGTTRPG
jgi:ribosome biogenesis GTPase